MHSNDSINNCINIYGKLRKSFLLFLETHFELELLDEKNSVQLLISEQPKRKNPFLEENHIETSSVIDGFEVL